MMDAGCYCLHALRNLVGAEPQVASATAQMVPGSKVGRRPRGQGAAEQWGGGGTGTRPLHRIATRDGRGLTCLPLPAMRRCAARARGRVRG